MTTSARRLWELFEPVHAVTYFSAEARQAADGLGFRGFWMGYVAFRSAPLGPVDAPVVTALFHGFAPRRVARALPDAWDIATPDAALTARRSAAGRALRRLLPEASVPEAADALWDAASAADTAGRALAAANAALPAPDDPFERLWQATTTLREHRGDGHVAALVAADVSPVEAHLLKVAGGESPEDALRVGRDWTDDEWADGVERLRRRGWTDGEGQLTAAGAAARREVEERTDEAAAGPWRRLGEERTAAVVDLLRPLARAVVDAGEVPYPNPIGLTPPA
ncbi:MAG: SCO6745 family protein [Actinomycetes bacterium]